jgi:hypothetical protein
MTKTSTNPTVPASGDVAEYPMARAAGCPFDPAPTLRVLRGAGA